MLAKSNNMPVSELVLQDRHVILQKNVVQMILKHRMDEFTDGRHGIISHLRQCQVK